MHLENDYGTDSVEKSPLEESLMKEFFTVLFIFALDHVRIFTEVLDRAVYARMRKVPLFKWEGNRRAGPAALMLTMTAFLFYMVGWL